MACSVEVDNAQAAPENQLNDQSTGSTSATEQQPHTSIINSV